MRLEDIYELYADKVYTFFYVQCSNQQTAEDLTSQTFMVLVEKLSKGSTPIADAKKYLYGVMRKVWLTYLRQTYKQKESLVESFDDFEAYVSHELDNTTTLHIRQRAEDFINRLPDRQKQVVRLRLLDEMSIKDIATHLGKDSNYVKTTYKRGLRRLKELVAAAVVAMLAIVIGMQALHSNAVSAQEVVERAQKYAKQLKDHTFYGQESQATAGPKANACSGITGISGSSKTYVFTALDGSLEAGYLYSDTAITNPREESYYSYGTHQLENLVSDRFTSPLPYLQPAANGKPAYQLVDAQGKPLGTDQVTPVRQDGRMVYSFYFRYSPETTGICREAIVKVVFDAKTYEPIGQSTYYKTVAPENLVFENRQHFDRKNISEAEALQIMTAAGFDKDAAYPKLRNAQ